MKKSFIKLFLLIGMLFVGVSTAYADDTFTFSIGGAKDVKAGDEFTVDVTVNGLNDTYTLNGFDLTVSYDTNKLTLIDGAPDNRVIRPEQGTITDSKITTIKFKVNSGANAGDTALKLEPNSVVIDGEAIPKNDSRVKFNGGTVTIRNIGTDNTLKSLKIPNTVLSPEFNKNVHDYTATVTDVTSVDIKAEPSDPHSTVWITENSKNLVKGVNDITIVCKAENGQELWYGIKITLNVTPTEEELKAQDTTLKSLTIKGQKLEFNSAEKKYYINVDYDVTKINVTATPNNPEAEVTITGNSKFIVGRNTVKINVTSKDKSKTDTYQIIVTRADEKKAIVKTCPDETSKMEWIIFTGSLLLTFTLGIVLGYFLCRKEVFNKLFKRKKKTDTPVEIETLSDTIDLSDTVKKVQPKEDVEELK